MTSCETARFSKQRHVQYGHGAVSTSQPLATGVGLQILADGGNAADAAVAVAAMLSVTEPPSNGIGGDFIALHHDGKTNSMQAFLGIGRSPKALTTELFCSCESTPASPHTATVPGAVAAWDDLFRRHCSGKISFQSLLNPAISAAEDGFFVHHNTSSIWAKEEAFLATYGSEPGPFLPVPGAGQLFKNADLAGVLKKIQSEGPDGFYKGEAAKRLVEALNKRGSVMSLEDLAQHETVVAAPLTTTYHDWTVAEVGAPTHGAIALLALNVLEYFDIAKLNRGDATHVMIEAIRQSFAAASVRIADSRMSEQDVRELVDKTFAKNIANLVKISNKSDLIVEGEALPKGGTVHFCIVDRDGNAVSAVQSNYVGFGTGIVPANCGFSVQCRGLNFSRDSRHTNSADGGKRPYHTIIPGMMTRSRIKEGEEINDLVAFGMMGSFMQPQGHVQVVSSIVDLKRNGQQALDLPRFRVTGAFSAVEPGMCEDAVLVENDMEEERIKILKEKGHVIRRSTHQPLFGRGHICSRRGEDGRVEAACDIRSDGVAAVWL